MKDTIFRVTFEPSFEKTLYERKKPLSFLPPGSSHLRMEVGKKYDS